MCHTYFTVKINVSVFRNITCVKLSAIYMLTIKLTDLSSICSECLILCNIFHLKLKSTLLKGSIVILCPGYYIASYPIVASLRWNGYCMFMSMYQLQFYVKMDDFYQSVHEFNCKVFYNYYIISVTAWQVKLQGVNKVRRHCSITYNFRINVHSILKSYRHTNLFNTKVRTILHLLQLYFI